MAADASADPRGIYMSLDDIIEENNKEKRNKSQNKLNQGEGFQGVRGRGRGGRSRGRGRSFGRGGRGNQQRYAGNDGQGQTVRVVVQNQAPSIEYRRVCETVHQSCSQMYARPLTEQVSCHAVSGLLPRRIWQCYIYLQGCGAYQSESLHGAGCDAAYTGLESYVL